MTTPLSTDLAAQLQGEPVQQISSRLGIDPAQAQAAIGAALPLLLGALGRNARDPRGAESLEGALRQDHAGLDLGSVLGTVLGGGGQGGQILGHVFGDRQPRAAQGLGQATGLGQDKAGMLLRLLAPLVMAYLAKRVFEHRQTGSTTTASSPKALGDVLAKEEAHAGAQGGLLGAVLDRDGDGDVDFSDLLKAGGSVLGGQPRA